MKINFALIFYIRFKNTNWAETQTGSLASMGLFLVPESIFDSSLQTTLLKLIKKLLGTFVIVYSNTFSFKQKFSLPQF